MKGILKDFFVLGISKLNRENILLFPENLDEYTKKYGYSLLLSFHLFHHFTVLKRQHIPISPVFPFII